MKFLFLQVTFSAVFSLLYSTTTFARSLTVNKALAPYGIKFNSKSPILTSSSNMGKAKVMSFHKLKFSYQGTDFSLEAIKPIELDKFQKFSKQKLYAISLLYKPTPTPYVGQLTYRTDCQKEFFPKIIRIPALGNITDVLQAPATNRNAFGACDKRNAKKVGLFAGLYSKKAKSGVLLKFFTSPGDISKYKKIISSFVRTYEE